MKKFYFTRKIIVDLPPPLSLTRILQGHYGQNGGKMYFQDLKDARC